MKFCKDCAHYVVPEGFLAAVPGAPFCSAEQCRLPVDLVSGKRRMDSCRRLREHGGACGEEGLMFISKEKPEGPKNRLIHWWRSN